MNDERDEFTVQQVGSRGVSRAVPILTFLVGIFLGAAVVKPWDLLFPSSTSVVLPPISTAAPSRAPTPEPVSSSVPAECAFAGGWRVFALGQPDRLGGDGSIQVSGASPDSRRTDIGNPLRRWLEVAPLEDGTGPLDPRIPFVTIVSDRIGGIGYCPPPSETDGPPAGATLDAWSMEAAGRPVPFPLRPAVLDPASEVEVAVFVGADQPPSSVAQWSTGRYIFAVETADGVYGRWFGVEIRSPPGRLSN